MKKIILLSVISLLFLFSGAKIVLACNCECNGPIPGTTGNYKGITASLAACDTVCTSAPINSTVKACLDSGAAGPSAPQTLPNPLGITDVNAFIAQLINFVLSLVGSVSLLLFVYGGITWMTSAGAPAAVKKGKDIVVWAVIGLAVVFTSYILVKFVIQGITGA